MQEGTITQTPRRRARTLGWALAGSVVALLMLGSMGGASVLAALGGNQLNQTPPISSDNVNFQGDEVECAGTPAGSVVWHFVLTKTAASSANLEAVFASGTVTQSSDFKTGQTLHWFFTTDAPETLLGASTNATGKNLNLSHICNGGETTTTTTETTTTDTGTTTTN
jgi:hypothetical protein